jgi:hypothetical protein
VKQCETWPIDAKKNLGDSTRHDDSDDAENQKNMLPSKRVHVTQRSI